MEQKIVALPDGLRLWRQSLHSFAKTIYTSSDPAHDMLHIGRVVHWALRLAQVEGADPFIVLPAAYLHDMVNLAKDDPRRKEASRLSSAAAVDWLTGQGYPAQYLDAVAHAIAAHSFSAGITPETIEAKVVQDADRLDALGAAGIARCFSVNAKFGSIFYHPDDFWATSRAPDDKNYAVDHFFVKLFKISETMHTDAARAEAAERVGFMKAFLKQLESESKNTP
jgi:uncharacterized protein